MGLCIALNRTPNIHYYWEGGSTRGLGFRVSAEILAFRGVAVKGVPSGPVDVAKEESNRTLLAPSIGVTGQ